MSDTKNIWNVKSYDKKCSLDFKISKNISRTRNKSSPVSSQSTSPTPIEEQIACSSETRIPYDIEDDNNE